MILLNNKSLLLALERISHMHLKRILRLKGFFLEKDQTKSPLEILIYKGFSSCTTHATDFDLDNSTLPKNAMLIEGELLMAPMKPTKNQIMIGPLKVEEFLEESNWT